MCQQPDHTPGNYYVVCKIAGRTKILLGPFKNNHQMALDLVQSVMELALKLDPMATYYSFGTANMGEKFVKPGFFNDRYCVFYNSNKEEVMMNA